MRAWLLVGLWLVGCSEPPPSLSRALASVSERAADAPLAAPAEPPRPSRYPPGRVHSPITASVSAALQRIAARGPALEADVFAKVGDSVTFSHDTLRCVPTEKLVLGKHADLGPLVERFGAGDAGGSDPFRRDSRAARIGWSAWQVLQGEPSFLEQEIEAIEPRYALVQFGTNDLELDKIHYFADRLADVVEALAERGVVPILFTVMTRRDRRAAAERVPLYNAVIRAVAQAWQVPLVDYFHAIQPLYKNGLSKDGIHPSTHFGRLGRNACDFTEAGLKHGYNMRNLLALQALGRAARGLDGPLDEAPAALRGAGTAREPFQVTKLPFVDARVVERDTHYRIELADARELFVYGFDRHAADVDLALGRAGSVVAAGKLEACARVEAGSYELVLKPRSPSPGNQTLLVAVAR